MSISGPKKKLADDPETVNDPGLHVVVLFTWDVSLKIWQQKGLLTREMRLYDALVNKGIKITFVTWGGREERKIAAKFPQFSFVHAYELVPKPANQALRALCSLLLPFKLKKLFKNCDILKTNQMWGAWVGVLAKWLTGTPLFVRTGFELYSFNVRQGQSSLRCKFVRFISRLSYRAAKAIAVATVNDRDFVVKNFDVDAKKIAIHPNWIDTDMFAPEACPQIAGRLMFVGRLNKQKNIPLLFEAMADTLFGLDIYGDGEMRGELQELARQIGVDVEFKGSVPNDDLPALYNSYYVYVICSHFEGNPETLLEAMACGRAVCGVDSPGISNVMVHGVSGWVCENTPESLCVGLKKLMDDSTLRDKLGQAARKQIVQGQSLDALVEKEMQIYKHLTD